MGQRGRDYLQSTPAFFMRRSEVHWFVLSQHPLGDLSCFSSSRALCQKGIMLDFQIWLTIFITLGLLWYFDIFATFWATSWKATITSGSCMAARTSGSLRISLSPGIPTIPGIPLPIPGIPPGKLPGIPPGKPPGKEPYWDPGCLLASSSPWVLSCYSQAFLTLSILSLISCSSRFCSYFLWCSAIFWALGWTSFSNALASSS